MNKIYFKDVPCVGDLYLEEVLFEYDYDPIVFVCKDNSNNRFLCLCDDVFTRFSWIITSVNTSSLINVLEGKETLMTPFKTSKNKIILANRDFGSKETNFTLCDYDDIDEKDLPSKDQYLEQKGNLDDYILSG